MAASLSFPTENPTEHSRFLLLVTNPKGQMVFAVISLCAIIVFNSFLYLYRPYNGMGLYNENPLGGVYDVDPGGPAERAGVQMGDQVISIDDRKLDSRRSEPRYKPGIRTGDIIVYEIQRGDDIVFLSIEIGSYSDNIPLIASLLGLQFLSISFWIVGLLLSLFVPPDASGARLLSLGFLMAGVTVAVGGASGWNSFWGANTIQLVLWSLLAPIIVAAHLTFPTITLPKYRGLIVNLFLIISLLLVGMVFLEEMRNHPSSTLLSNFIGLTLRQVVFGYFMFSWAVGVGLLIRNHFLSKDPEMRRQTGIVIWGMALGIGPFFALTLIPYIMFGAEYIPGFYTILFLVLLPLSYAYVIFQRKLLRVDLIINRIVVLFVLALAILFITVLFFGVVTLVFDLPIELPLLAGIMMAIAVLPMVNAQKFVQKKVNIVLYGSHYDFSTVTSSLSSQLAKTLDRDNLVNLLTTSLAQQMGINQIALLLNQDDQLKLQQPAGEPFSVTFDNELCDVLENNQAPVRPNRLWVLLSSETRNQWRRFRWGQLLVPMIFEDRLHGILILGTRSSGDVYSDQDIQIIASVAHQGALASANVLLVEDLRGLTQDLVRSDETQRKQVARELHDTVLQDLFFIKQRIRRAQDYPELGDYMEEIIQKLRGIIKAQRPPLLDQGLVLALRGLVEDMQKIAGALPILSWQSNLKDRLDLTDEQATSIFRIAQEAVNNALKHAEAKNIIVKLEQIPNGGLRLVVEDDGVGMESSGMVEGPDVGQYGLVGMRERAYMIGARLEINSYMGRGTAVILELKL